MARNLLWSHNHSNDLYREYKQPLMNTWNGWHNVGYMPTTHDDVIKWKHFPRYWLFVRGIHRSPVNSPHKGQWRGALMFSLICTRINGWVNNREAGDLARHYAYYDVIVMVGYMPTTIRPGLAGIQIYATEWWLRYLLWNFPQMIHTRPYWW